MPLEKCYSVQIEGDTIATNMSLDTAMLLVKAVFEEYYNDTNMKVVIEKQDNSILDVDPIVDNKPTI